MACYDCGNRAIVGRREHKECELVWASSVRKSERGKEHNAVEQGRRRTQKLIFFCIISLLLVLLLVSLVLGVTRVYRNGEGEGVSHSRMIVLAVIP